MKESTRRPQERSAETGFTLVEAIVAILVLVFGLMAVTNLMIVAASSNTVANQGTAATTSATRVMDLLKSVDFMTLFTKGLGQGKDWSTTDGAGKVCDDPALRYDDWHCTESLAGVGPVHTHWWVTDGGQQRLLYIRVRSEGMGALTARRSRAEFTTFRACTNHIVANACPPPPVE